MKELSKNEINFRKYLRKYQPEKFDEYIWNYNFDKLKGKEK